MGATDQMLARYVAEIEERQQFIDSLVESSDGKDLTDEKAELVTEARNRIERVNEMMKPLEEARRISGDSAERIRQLAVYMQGDKQQPQQVEYRSAGAYALDMWQAGLGDEKARDRMRRWGQENRAAAHETTADITGLLPAPIVGGVVNFIDAARPVVGQLGPRQLPSSSFKRPKVTQHTAVAAQSAEKAELTSQKMIITSVSPTPSTLGGYVNISRQSISWSEPQVMDLVIQDLAAQYAILTEETAVQAFYAGGTAGPTIPATPSAADVAGALWTAAGSLYTATKGQGRIIAAVSPDVLGIIGPLFAPVNPTNAQSAGFSAGDFGQGVVGSVAGITVVVTAGFAATKHMMVLSTAAAEVYEDRIGSLSVVEPSVLGVQVAYAGMFAPLIIDATGIIKVTVT
jgi:HK97 family phage major capsid protein